MASERPGVSDEEMRIVARKFEALFERGICPHCDQPMMNARQVGRCAYGEPCGCRLGQMEASVVREAIKARHADD